MKNGKYESEYAREVIKQLKLMNTLLLDHTDHLICIRAYSMVMMLYLPACASGQEASKEVVRRLIRAYAKEDQRLRRRTRKTLRKRIQSTFTSIALTSWPVARRNVFAESLECCLRAAVRTASASWQCRRSQIPTGQSSRQVQRFDLSV